MLVITDQIQNNAGSGCRQVTSLCTPLPGTGPSQDEWPQHETKTSLRLLEMGCFNACMLEADNSKMAVSEAETATTRIQSTAIDTSRHVFHRLDGDLAGKQAG